MFTIYGGKTEFNQWEQGQMITNPDMAVGDKVRFWNASGETHPMIAYKHDGVVAVDVPNDLLQRASPILVDLCGKPEYLTRFMVNFVSHKEPEGYQYIDNTHCEPVVPVCEAIPIPPVADVGQTIVVSEVDAEGKPIKWEAADMASGGGGSADAWELIAEGELTGDDETVVANIIIDVDQNGEPFLCKKVAIAHFLIGTTDSGADICVLATTHPNYLQTYHNFGLQGNSIKTTGVWANAIIEHIGGVVWNTMFKGISGGAATPAQTSNYDSYIYKNLLTHQATPDGDIRGIKFQAFSGKLKAGSKWIIYGVRA